MTIAQTITEATANKLIDSMQDLKIAIAVSTEKIEAQNRWNEDQRKINTIVADKLLSIAEGNVKRDARLDALEGWKNWLNGVFTAVLVVILVAVAVAAMYMTYGGPRP